MIIYTTIKMKSILKYFFILIGSIICITILFIHINNSHSVSAFRIGSKDLPIYYVDTPEKIAAITFDCAWGAEDIPNILSTLKKEEARASFFIVGQWAEKYPDTVKMIAEAGHDIANHGYSHLRMGALDKDKIKSEIMLCGEKLAEISGKKVELFRPPYGDYSNNVVSLARELGYFTIQWNVDSLDWKPGISQNEILERIMKKIQPGSVLLFHNDTAHTAKLLPTIIKNLKEEGYRFLPTSELIMRNNFYIDHEGKQKTNE